MQKRLIIAIVALYEIFDVYLEAILNFNQNITRKHLDLYRLNCNIYLLNDVKYAKNVIKKYIM